MRIFSIAIGLALSACAVASTTAPTVMSQVPPTDPAIIARVKAEHDAATDEYVKCLFRAAKTLDDRKSDPATIGQAMLAACAVKFNHQVMTYWSGDVNLEQLERDMREGALGRAIQIVLTLRQKGRSAAKPSPATAHKRKAAASALTSCMLANDHDDGISDAATIGRALMSACAREFKKSMRADGIVMDKLNNADLNKVTKSNLALATKFVLHQRELLAKAKRCIEQAGRIAAAAVTADPSFEEMDKMIKRTKDYTKKLEKDARSCPPFLTH